MTQRTGLVFGATGTLGQALMAEAELRGIALLGVARRDIALRCDIRDAQAIDTLWRETDPAFVINAAALTDLAACERNPGLAYAINAHGPANLARMARRNGALLVQISTDQFFEGDGRRLHTEDEPALPINVYGASKLAGEYMALSVPENLVIRTNVTGYRGWPNRPTFAEWCAHTILEDDPVTLFTDYYTSTIDAPSLARTLFDLIDVRARGILNVASREASSKAYFINALCRCFSRTLSDAKRGSVAGLFPERTMNAGLDVSRAEHMLGYRLPTLAQVTQALYTEYQRRKEDLAPCHTDRLSA